ncbi:DUF4309 domain-containing protein [Salinithrix halophila]|uniref:DUF4309 domain-containing protein n=1 Tax=Salinithrix halophila TaxID=1485204 RepID=A0ABV8JHG3_9BACL
MGKFFYLFMIGLMMNTSCIQSDLQETRNHQESIVTLDKETIRLFNKGKVKGIPFPLSNFPFKQVTEKWGKPNKQIDNEDIQDYIYKRNGQEIIFTVDETNIVMYYQIKMNISLEEVNRKLGNRYKVKPTTYKALTYPMGRYELRVRRITPADQVILDLSERE